MDNTSRITLYDESDFRGLRRAGQLAAACLDFIEPHVVPGVNTEKLNDLCDGFIRDHDAIPAPLNYRGFPKSICTSVNRVICHGIPSKNHLLREGDIINIDVTVILDGWHGDTSRMYGVGDKIPLKARRLCTVTWNSLNFALDAVRPGATLGDIGHAIQHYAEGMRMSVVRDFVGHGIGRKFHEPPHVFHFGNPGKGLALLVGMVFTIEPMVNFGKPHGKMLSDGWTAVTQDRTLSAQYEHMLAVTKDGLEVFTHSPLGLQDKLNANV
ncbi:MAG: type I methionyl aminopeptidase [Alphaproteobacteria bacterium]|nr:type I methionyl aminopeptidase [Alphaproteobacteria bacterium]